MSKSTKYHLITLGCPKNIVDSENMSALLEEEGFQNVSLPEEADVIIINTCCFIEQAKTEAIETILEASEIKQETGASLVVTGCFPQRYKDEIADEIPEVDSWIGLENPKGIAELIANTVSGKKIRSFYDNPPEVFTPLPRKISTPGGYSYIKIAEGCSHSCSFCAIPGIRGKYRSLPMEAVETQADNAAQSGKREIILIAQDTTLYGIDLYGKPMLSQLLERLCSIEEVQWIRLMYAYPSSISETLLETIAANKKICSYVDIPLQHSHPEVLKKMSRPRSEKDTAGLIKKIRSYLPDAAIRSSFITGHPGETPARFEHLLNFIKEMEFYNLGVFEYSREEGTESAKYSSLPTHKEAKRRKNELLKAQQKISKKIRRDKIGSIIPAVIDTVLEKRTGSGGIILDMEGKQMTGFSEIPEDITAIGRTVYDAPDIDGVLLVRGTPPPEGAFFNALIKDAGEYDLIGEAV